MLQIERAFQHGIPELGKCGMIVLVIVTQWTPEIFTLSARLDLHLSLSLLKRY